MLKKAIGMVSIAVIVLNCSLAHAAEITGIGEFLIGMSEDEFLNTPYVQTLSVSEKKQKMYVPKGKSVWKTDYNSDVADGDKVYSEDIVKYELNMPLGIQDAIKDDSYNSTLYFYKGNLVRIYVHRPPLQIEELLTKKYGKPYVDDRMKVISCQNKFGAREPGYAGEKKLIWGKGKKVTGTFSKLGMFCEFGLSWGYEVENSVEAKKIDAVQKKGMSEAQKKNEATKLNQSKI